MRICEEDEEALEMGDAVQPDVLIVEDEERLLELITAVFSRMGTYRVRQARDGREAFAAIRKAKPDVVVLDVLLPDASGLDICETLKSDPETQDLKVIILTALAQDHTRREARQRGADAYLTKPFSPLALREAVDGLMTRETGK